MINSMREYCVLNSMGGVKTALLMELAEYLENHKISNDLFKLIYDEYNSAELNKHYDNEDVIPQHYTKLAIEPIKFIADHNLNFCAGNIVKYVSRLGNKDSDKDELKKIFFYFDYLIHGNYNLTNETFNKKTLVLIGGGVANLYSACYGYMHNILQKYNVIVIEKGKLLHERGPKDIVYGLFGAGAFSDNKNVFSFQPDQPIFNYIDNSEAQKYYQELNEVIHKLLYYYLDHLLVKTLLQL